MGPGGIATIIAASSLCIIAAAVAYVVVRIGRLIDQAKATIDTFTKETTPLIEEVTTTVHLVNGPLESINKITKTAENIVDKVSSVTSDVVDKAGPAMKIASMVIGAAQSHKSNKKSDESNKKANESSYGSDENEEFEKPAKSKRTTRPKKVVQVDEDEEFEL